MIGTIQPDRIAELISGADDGMAARFLYAWPEPTDYMPLMDRHVPGDEDALDMLQHIARIAGSAQTPLLLRFDVEAIVEFDHFLRTLHAETRDLDGLEAGWLGKGPGTVARLAAILTLLAWSATAQAEAPQIVPATIVQDAVTLWRTISGRMRLRCSTRPAPTTATAPPAAPCAGCAPPAPPRLAASRSGSRRWAVPSMPRAPTRSSRGWSGAVSCGCCRW